MWSRVSLIGTVTAVDLNLDQAIPAGFANQPMMQFLSGLADPLGEAAIKQNAVDENLPLQHPDTSASFVQQSTAAHPKSLMERMVSDLQSDPVSSASNVIPPDSLETGLFASMQKTDTPSNDHHAHHRLRGWVKRGWAWGTPPWAKERHGMSAKKTISHHTHKKEHEQATEELQNVVANAAETIKQYKENPEEHDGVIYDRLLNIQSKVDALKAAMPDVQQEQQQVVTPIKLRRAQELSGAIHEVLNQHNYKQEAKPHFQPIEPASLKKVGSEEVMSAEDEAYVPALLAIEQRVNTLKGVIGGLVSELSLATKEDADIPMSL